MDRIGCQGTEVGSTDPVQSAALSSRHPSHLLESTIAQAQEERVTTSSEPVLCCLQDATTSKVLITLLDGQLHHGIHHVLELVGAGHLTRLVDLTNDYRVTEVFLAVVSHHGQATLS